VPLPDHRYCSYLLRLWWTAADGQSTCRVALESTQDGARRVFADLDALFVFLKAWADGLERPNGGTNA
jgi:hypothetical protein